MTLAAAQALAPDATIRILGDGPIMADVRAAAAKQPKLVAPGHVPREEALAGVNKNGQVLTNTDDPAEGKARGGYYRHLRQTGGWSLGVTGIDAVKEPGKLDRFCPVKQITRDYPPILMIHGTEDTDVPYFCSTDMARELTKHGVKHELLTVQGAEHGLRDGDPKRVAEVNARALEFIKELLAAK